MLAVGLHLTFELEGNITEPTRLLEKSTAGSMVLVVLLFISAFYMGWVGKNGLIRDAPFDADIRSYSQL